MREVFFKRKFVFFILMIFALQICAAQNSESSGVDRYAIFVGSNVGGKNNQRLMYAGTDAMAFQKTMNEIGGIPKSNAVLLLDPTKDDLDDAIQTVSEMIRHNNERSKRSEFLFYYSGHSDENALLLGNSNYDYSGLKAAITNVPSDVHVVILDSCYSGNFIRTKGGQRKKPFLLDDSSVVKGHAYLSSSSSQEYSQESDEIGSSFFTNAMLSGLRGAADSSGDKKVTLNELYSYAFNETLSKTENTSAGPQHPNYNITLVGSGDLVLSDISNSDSVVMLSSELKGRVILRDKNGNLISEINKSGEKPVFLAMEKGDYSATLISDTMTMQGSFFLNSSKVYELSPKSLSPVSGTFNRIRGGDETEEASEQKTEELVEETEPEEDPDTRYVPFEFSFAANEISRMFGKKVRASGSLGVIRSSIYRINGAMVSSIENEADYVYGAQAAGIFNVAGELNGAQASGIFNRAGGNVNGVQAAGIFNTTHDVNGAQAAGIFNVAKNVRGVQTAGIFNVADDFNGAQVAGIFNKADVFTGVQVAGIANASEVTNHIQVAGIANYTKRLGKNAMQVGFVNIAKELDGGYQFGLINYSKNGLFEFGLGYTTNNTLRLTINSGNKELYCIFGNWKPVHDWFTLYDPSEHLTGSFFGFGSRLITKNIFFMDYEGWADTVYYCTEKTDKDGETKYSWDIDVFGTFRLVFGITPVKNFRFYAATNFMCDFYHADEVFNKMHKLIDLNFHDKFHIYPDIEIGVKFFPNN